MVRRVVLLSCLALLTQADPGSAQTPKLTKAEARSLYAAGGFPIAADDSGPLNPCGQKARPRITFVDMNGDKKPEALFIDTGTCYGSEGRWYAVATRMPNGQWRQVIGGAGTVQATGTAFNGWFVLNRTAGGETSRWRYDGTVYRPVDPAAVTPPAPAAPPAPTAETKAAPAADAKAATPADGDSAIFLAAGFKKTKRGWESGCDDPSAGAAYDAGRIDHVGDLNGDGRPEALVVEGGTYCYGNTGEAFQLMSQQADGSWKLIHSEIGIAEFLKTKGTGGWPDISIGGPGFCFPVYRYNGKEYVLNRQEYEGKACKR